MSDYRKPRRHSRRRPPAKAQEGRVEGRTQHRARWSTGFRDNIAILVALSVLVPIAVFSFLYVHRSDQRGEQPAEPPSADSAFRPRAAIVDQLSLTQPNRAFVDTATEVLEQVGYAVGYYPGEVVTVEFYRDLPYHGYSLLILRNHSSEILTRIRAPGRVGLYTSEPYVETEHVDEQIASRLIVARYHEGGPEYFGIAPDFVRSSMRGSFDDATVILMGCDGLKSDALAEAFLQRGAEYVVGWSGLVGAAHTDAATELFLRHLLVDRLTMQEAVTQTMAQVGPDPEYDSVLRVHASEESVSAVP